MVNGEHELFSLRIKILYFLQYYLFKNNIGKSMIVEAFFSQGKNV
jgi:hypothetical protein